MGSTVSRGEEEEEEEGEEGRTKMKAR